MRVSTENLLLTEIASWVGNCSRLQAEEAIQVWRETHDLSAGGGIEAIYEHGGILKLLRDSIKQRHEVLAKIDSGGFGLYQDRSSRPRNWRQMTTEKNRKAERQEFEF